MAQVECFLGPKGSKQRSDVERGPFRSQKFACGDVEEGHSGPFALGLSSAFLRNMHCSEPIVLSGVEDLVVEGLSLIHI